MRAIARTELPRDVIERVLRRSFRDRQLIADLAIGVGESHPSELLDLTITQPAFRIAFEAQALPPGASVVRAHANAGEEVSTEVVRIFMSSIGGFAVVVHRVIDRLTAGR